MSSGDSSRPIDWERGLRFQLALSYLSCVSPADERLALDWFRPLMAPTHDASEPAVLELSVRVDEQAVRLGVINSRDALVGRLGERFVELGAAEQELEHLNHIASLLPGQTIGGWLGIGPLHTGAGWWVRGEIPVYMALAGVGSSPARKSWLSLCQRLGIQQVSEVWRNVVGPVYTHTLHIPLPGASPRDALLTGLNCFDFMGIEKPSRAILAGLLRARQLSLAVGLGDVGVVSMAILGAVDHIDLVAHLSLAGGASEIDRMAGLQGVLDKPLPMRVASWIRSSGWCTELQYQL